MSDEATTAATGLDRRAFLRSLSAAAALVLPLETALARLASPDEPLSALARFEPIAATDADDLVLPEGFVYDVVIKWGDTFTKSGDRFGFNNDFIGVFPVDSADDALLWINHEYVSLATTTGNVDLYGQTFRMLRGQVPSVRDYKRDVGGSVVRVRRDGASGAWAPVLRDPLNRRVDAFTPCRVDGPAAPLMRVGVVEGTFDNCAGSVTPWGTALSCEENIQARVPDQVDTRGRYRRGGMFDLPGGHYGWVVEVDPHDPTSAPLKHTALGRFRHEGVGIRAVAGQPLAGYMGDDRIGGHVWKYVSAGLYQPGRPDNRALLTEGTLYAARFNDDGTGEWRPIVMDSALDPAPSPRDPKPPIPAGAHRLGDVYASLGAALMDAYRAANCVGGTPSGRPEDIEVHPADGSVFISFTASSERPGLWPNLHGEVWRLEEDGGDQRARSFRWARFSVGGPPDPERSGHVFTQPDNLVIDRRGDLWLATDIAGEHVNARPPYAAFKNCGVFRIPVTGPDRGRPSQFASLPCESEATGPAFAPDESALFLSVQHPGERYGTRFSASAAPRGSNWPSRRLGTPP
ncbi:MAG TPA: alkaline phosphatase PhoX, partial [Vicinamibacteria bacterium]|nr:alkaline phosphatase PhoX [Vicinamibacteria bacterium]